MVLFSNSGDYVTARPSYPPRTPLAAALVHTRPGPPGRCCHGNIVLAPLFPFNASFYTFILYLLHTTHNYGWERGGGDQSGTLKICPCVDGRWRTSVFCSAQGRRLPPRGSFGGGKGTGRLCWEVGAQSSFLVSFIFMFSRTVVVMTVLDVIRDQKNRKNKKKM